MAPMPTITAIGSTCKQCQFVMSMCFSGNNLQSSTDLSTSGEASETTPTKTKKLFVTGMLQPLF